MLGRGVLPDDDQMDDEGYERPDTPQPRRPVDRAGLASLLIGGLALPAASLSWLCYPATALALVGGGLGIAGLVRACKRQARFLWPAVGLGACLLALLLAAWPDSRSKADTTDPDAPQVVRLYQKSPTERNITVSESWVDASREAAQQSGVRVKVLGAMIQRVPLVDRQGRRLWSKERGLLVHLRISNMALDRPVQYGDWSAPATAGDQPALVDQLGRAYKSRTFGPDLTVIGKGRRTGLAPGKWTDDVLVFFPPPPDVVFLRLSLPASTFGGKGLVRLQVPRQMIVFR
jgi:hypothetical protein